MSDALVDFTSGVSEVIDLEAKSGVLRSAESEEKKALFKSLVDEIEDHALMCAAIRVRKSIILLIRHPQHYILPIHWHRILVLLQASTPEEMEERTDLGLVKGHAYGITAVKRIPLGETSLITLFK